MTVSPVRSVRWSVHREVRRCLPVAERRADDAHRPGEGERAQRHHREAASRVASGARLSGRLPRYVYGFVLRQMRQVAVVDHRAVGEAHGEPGPAAVVVADPGVEAGVDEQRVAGVALEPGAPLHLGDHGGVEAHPDVEEEVAAVHRRRGRPAGCCRWASASSRSPVASIGSLGSPIVRANTLVEPPGQRRQRARRAGQPVGRLVERAVAAEHHDDLGAGCRPRPGPGGWRGPGGWSRRGSPRGRRTAPSGSPPGCAPSPTTPTSSPAAAPSWPRSNLPSARVGEARRGGVRRCRPCTSSSV